MKKILYICASALLLTMYTSPLLAAESLCVKKKLPVKKGKVELAKAFTLREGECTKAERVVLTGTAAADLFAKVLGLDGAASTLDADTLDGQHASAFGSATDLATLSATSADHTTTLASHASTLDQHGSSLTSQAASLASQAATIATNSADIDTLQSTTATQTANIATLQGTTATQTSNISTLQTDLGTANGSISTLSTTTSQIISDVEDLGVGPRVVRVGTADARFTSIHDAITYVDSQIRNSATRWIIQVGPGVFTLTSAITIPTYTTLNGSGRDSTTIVLTNNDAYSAIITADYTTISNITIQRVQTTNYGQTVIIEAVSTVDADIEDPSAFPVVIEDARLELTSANPSSSTGINYDQSDILVNRTQIKISGASTTNRGLAAISGDGNLLLLNSEVYVAGNQSEGVTDQSTEDLKIRNCYIYGHETGVRKVYGPARILSSEIVGRISSGLLAYGNAIMYVHNSVIDASTNRTEGTGGAITCVDTSDETGAAVAC